MSDTEGRGRNIIGAQTMSGEGGFSADADVVRWSERQAAQQRRDAARPPIGDPPPDDDEDEDDEDEEDEDAA